MSCRSERAALPSISTLQPGCDSWRRDSREVLKDKTHASAADGMIYDELPDVGPLFGKVLQMERIDVFFPPEVETNRGFYYKDIVAHCSRRGGVYCPSAAVLGSGGSVFT